MKLLFCISSMRGGGAERVMSIICNKLIERGYDVYLATNMQLPILYDIDKKVNVLDIYVPRTRNKIKNAYKYRKRIREVVKQINPDIIITFVWPLNVIVLLATLGLSIPVIASEHSTFDKKKSLYESFVRFYINRLADKVTILTQHDYIFLKKKLPQKNVVPNPLPYKVYEGNSERMKNILAVGSIDRWYIKGFDSLIKIWEDISPLYPDWTLDIAGNGNEQNIKTLKKMAQDNSVSESIRFLGFQNDIHKLMQESSIFVLSSRYEGLPMVLVEAMSQGCACVSFDCKTGPAEIMTNNISGLLIKDQDLDEMKEALIRLIDNENLRTSLSIQGRKEIKKFDSDLIVDKWAQIFQELMELKVGE